MSDRSSDSVRRRQTEPDRRFGNHERARNMSRPPVPNGTRTTTLPTFTGVVHQMNVRPAWVTAHAAPSQMIIRSVTGSDHSMRARIWVVQQPFINEVPDLAVDDTVRFEAEVTPDTNDSDGSRWGFRRVLAIRRLDDEL